MKRFSLALSVIALWASQALAAAPSALTAGGGVNTKQYHSYDGLVCTDCHTLHNSEGGVRVAGNKLQSGPTDWSPGPYQALLKKGDFTDICLSCHKEGFNSSATADMVGVVNSGWTAPIVMTLTGTAPAGYAMPAGDFYYSNLDAKKGHNPAYTEGSAVPTSKLMASDPTLTNVPPGNGGVALSGEWSCHSCHGMHSRFSDSYTAWRQLVRKVNGKSVTGDVSGFGVETAAGNVTQDPAYEPIKSNSRGDIQGMNYVNLRKDGNPLEGADLLAAYADTNKNVYRGGFSSYCSACHGNFHGGIGETRTADNGNTRTGGAWVRHPTNVVMNEANSKYGISTYTKAVTNTQGNNPNPPGYDFRYPLIQPDNDFTVKSTVASAAVAATALGTSRISCLTCHKAHASKFDNMVRFDAKDHAFLAVGSDDVEGVTYDSAAGALVAGTSLGDNAAFGCGKCHQKGGTKAYVKAF